MSPTTTKRPPAHAPRPAIDPRVRARRVKVGREAGRRRRYVLFSALGLVTVGVCGYYVAHTSLFSVRVITVSGNVHETTAEVVAASQLSSHTALVDVNAIGVATRIDALPYVASATVHSHWPDAVSITIVERTPVAVVAAKAGGIDIVDAAGRVLATTPTAPAGLMAVTVSAGPAPGHYLPSSDLGALEVARTLPVALRGQVSAVVLEPDGTLNLTLDVPVTVKLGSDTQLTPKYEDAASMLAQLKLHAGDVIDVSVPSAPIVSGP